MQGLAPEAIKRCSLLYFKYLADFLLDKIYLYVYNYNDNIISN